MTVANTLLRHHRVPVRDSLIHSYKSIDPIFPRNNSNARSNSSRPSRAGDVRFAFPSASWETRFPLRSRLRTPTPETVGDERFSGSREASRIRGSLVADTRRISARVITSALVVEQRRPVLFNYFEHLHGRPRGRCRMPRCPRRVAAVHECPDDEQHHSRGTRARRVDELLTSSLCVSLFSLPLSHSFSFFLSVANSAPLFRISSLRQNIGKGMARRARRQRNIIQIA